MNNKLVHSNALKNFDPQNFLESYWQKQPLLIPQGLALPADFISPDELAGLAMEDEVESRLVYQSGKDWQLKHGPLIEQDFAEMPPSHWTLLVQTVDYWLPEVSPWLKQFSFIPDWRFDDLMVSFAADGGGVGPHIDRYDVFLVQAEGKRRWRVGAPGEPYQTITNDCGLQQIAPFKPIIDIEMCAGDILYIPPNTAHWGESIGNSLGYSVGYRAPSTKDILALLCEHLDSQPEPLLFSDPYRKQLSHHQVLDPELVQWAQQEIRNLADNQALIARLMSGFLSQPKLNSLVDDQQNQLLSSTASDVIQLAEHARCNWYFAKNQIILSIEGESVLIPSNYESQIKTLCSGQAVELKEFNSANKKFDFLNSLTNMINEGFILFKK